MGLRSTKGSVFKNVQKCYILHQRRVRFVEYYFKMQKIYHFKPKTEIFLSFP